MFSGHRKVGKVKALHIKRSLPDALSMFSETVCDSEKRQCVF